MRGALLVFGLLLAACVSFPSSPAEAQGKQKASAAKDAECRARASRHSRPSQRQQEYKNCIAGR